MTIGATLAALASQTAVGQVVGIVMGGPVGQWTLALGNLPPSRHHIYGVRAAVGATLLLIGGVPLVLLPGLAALTGWLLFSAGSVFYQAGALVFGGEHIALPLLQTGVVPPGWISNDVFPAGYGAAQAVPGPLFTFAAFLGTAMPSPLGGCTGGLILLLTIFLPALLLIVGTLPFWETLRQTDKMRRAMAGIKPAVGSVLAAALYDSVWISAMHSGAHFGLALATFGLLHVGKVQPVVFVIPAAVGEWVLTA